MADPTKALKEMEPAAEFFVGIDSDGCVFDTMEIKHKECFCPQFINHYGLQPVSKYAREVWEFVNLYSTTRGTNRFRAILRALDLVADREETKARKVAVPKLEALREWVQRETKLGNPALEEEIRGNPHPDLKRVMAWSIEVNDTIRKIVRNVPPFPLVRECLAKMQRKADSIVVSQTPLDALVREWQEHGIDGHVRAIAGQEMGTKGEHITYAAKGKYPPAKMLMIGDAPGDLKAARANNALFFPVNPGHEEASWERLYRESLDRFFAGSYSGDYERELLSEFESYLPEDPPWKT